MIRNKRTMAILLIMFLSVSVITNSFTALCDEGSTFSDTEGVTEEQGENTFDESAADSFDEQYLEEYPETDVEENEDINVPYSRGRVTRVIEEEKDSMAESDIDISAPTQVVEVLVVKGLHKGETVQADYSLSYNFSSEYKLNPLREGDEVLLYFDENADGTVAAAYVVEYARDKYLLYLVIAFILALVVIGRGRGVKAVVSLVLTAVAVVKILIPAILAGRDPVFISVAVCAGVIGATMLIISGPNRKALSAIIGTTGGVVIAGVISMLVGSMAQITGLGGDETQMLMYIPQNIHFDFKGLLFAGILLGTMGANMDVGMSIASAMHEIKATNPQIKSGDLMKAGMNVGRDIMATMSNTLILAYAGGSLQLMLILMAYDTPFSHVINWDVIASEVLRAISGSIGLVFTIPITAFVSAAIEKKLGQAKAYKSSM